MKVAKEFRWEGAHRLPWHAGPCAHLHGHSYRLTVELEGTPDARGMLVDFQHLKQRLQPLLAAFDHATLVAASDQALRQALETLGSRHVVLPFDTTSENLCGYVADYLEQTEGAWLRAHGITRLVVTVRETETCYATLERTVRVGQEAGPVGYGRN